MFIHTCILMIAMKKLLIITLLCTVTHCSGSGATGSHGSSGSSSEDGMDDNVLIMKVPKPLKLECNVTAADGEKFTVLWYKGEDAIDTTDRIKANAYGTLSFMTTKQEDVGDYNCQRSLDGVSIMVQEFTVLTLMSNKRLPKSTIYIAGDTLSLSCDVTGSPMPDVEWTKGNASIVVDNEHVFLKKMTDNVPENSTLVIENVDYGDEGLYTCSFQNHPNLPFSMQTNVRVKDIYAALWPFLGIVLEVLLLCLIIFIYEKRRTQNECDESDTDQGTGKGGR